MWAEAEPSVMIIASLSGFGSLLQDGHLGYSLSMTLRYDLITYLSIANVTSKEIVVLSLLLVQDASTCLSLYVVPSSFNVNLLSFPGNDIMVSYLLTLQIPSLIK